MIDRQDERHPLEALVDRAVKSARDGQVRVDDLLHAFGNRSFGPLIALLALVAIVPPVSGIPGVPAVIGVLVALLAGQIVFGRRHPWLPGFIRKRGVSAERLAKMRDKAGKWLARIDRVIGARLTWAAGPVAQRVAAACCAALGLMMVPLDLVPFVAAAPAGAILLFGLGLTARDGLLMLLGFAASAASVWLAVTQLL